MSRRYKRWIKSGRMFGSWNLAKKMRGCRMSLWRQFRHNPYVRGG